MLKMGTAGLEPTIFSSKENALPKGSAVRGYQIIL